MWIKLVLFCGTKCCLTKSQKRKERILSKGNELFDQELDIMNLIKSQRIFHTQLSFLLTPSQQIITRKQAEQVIDSSEENNQPSDASAEQDDN